MANFAKYITFSNLLIFYESLMGKINSLLNKPTPIKNISSLNTINVSTGKVFKKTITSNTNFKISGDFETNEDYAEFILILINGGSKTITFDKTISDVSVIRNLAADGKDILKFTTYDSGNIWDVSSIFHDEIS